MTEVAADIGIRSPMLAIVSGVRAIPSEQTPLGAVLDAESDAVQAWIAAARTTREANGFRKLFGRLGYPEQLGAFERLAESTLSKGFRRVNAIVDAYNVASLRMGSPIGCHDLASITSDMVIDRAPADCRIIPLFQTKSRPVPSGDLIYSSGGNVMCWMGRKDVDSDLFSVRPKTTSVVVMAIGNEDAEGTYNQAVCEEAVRWLMVAFPSAEAQLVPGKLRAIT